MPNPIVLAFGDIIIEKGVASTAFQTWMDDVTNSVNNTIPLSGSGSPEGVEVASVGRWYVDITANVIYYKNSGDEDTGWILAS